MRLLSMLALLALLAACGEEFRPASYVDGLRVLAVIPEPPDVRPGGSTQLDALVVDPRAPSRRNTLIWLACNPDPKALEQSPCSQFETLADPAELATVAEGSAVTFLGLGPGVRYSAPSELFAALGPEDPNRRRGVLALVLLLAIAEEVDDPAKVPELLERVKTRQVDAVVAIKRVRISEDDPQNLNPGIAAVRFDDEEWAPGLRPAKLKPGQTYTVTGIAAEGAAERYMALDAENKPIERDEKLIFSWFATAGIFDQPRTEAGQPTQRFTVPFLFERLPPNRLITLYTVLRDGRGGISSAVRGIYVCEPSLPVPTVTSVEPPSPRPGEKVTLVGEGLGHVLDVEIGGRLLSLPKYDEANGTFEGFVASDVPPGPQRLLVRGRGCRADPERTIEIATP